MKKFIFLLTAFFTTASLYAQQLSPTVVASAGGFFSGGNAQISWTLGETVIETTGGSNVILTQGFQQSDLNVNAIGEEEHKLAIQIFPNPTAGILNLRAEQHFAGECFVQIFSIDGRKVHEQQLLFSGNAAVLQLQQLEPGTYLLLLSNQQQSQNYTMIKY